MPDRRRVRCRVCGRHADDVGLISWRGKCGECGPRLLVENCDALHYKRGPELTRWRRAMAASVGAVLLDDAYPPA